MNKMKSFYSALALTALAVNLLGCEMKKNLDEMHDNTKEMGETTKSMEKTTTQMAGRTDEMYVGLREGETTAAQDEAFDSLIHEPGTNSKVANAAKYFGAMEFQYWYPWPTETEADRELLYLKNVESFFAKIDDLIKDDMPVWELWPSEQWTALSALAVAMSKVSFRQISLAKKYKFEAVSFYDLMKDGLNAKADYLAGKQIPEYQVRVLRNETKVRYLLQLRHNFFKAIVLSSLTKLEEAWNDKVWLATFGWSVEMEKMQDAEIRQLNEWLWKSAETQIYMKSIKEPIVHNEMINHIFSRGELKLNSQNITPSMTLIQDDSLVALEDLHSVKKTDALASFVGMLPRVLGVQGPWLNQPQEQGPIVPVYFKRW